MRGILVSSGITLIVVILNYFMEGHIFMYLMMIATCAAVISWVTICVTHLKFKQHCAATNHPTKFHAILYPFTNYLSLAFLAGVKHAHADTHRKALARVGGLFREWYVGNTVRRFGGKRKGNPCQKQNYDITRKHR